MLFSGLPVEQALAARESTLLFNTAILFMYTSATTKKQHSLSRKNKLIQKQRLSLHCGESLNDILSNFNMRLAQLLLGDRGRRTHE